MFNDDPDFTVLEFIEKLLTPKEYRGYLKGCILKYRLIAGRKGSQSTVDDIRKSMKYEELLIQAEGDKA